ncbi:MAG TPA: hypothetical protein VGH07_09360 [Chthoniobacterales bacterium]
MSVEKGTGVDGGGCCHVGGNIRSVPKQNAGPRSREELNLPELAYTQIAKDPQDHGTEHLEGGRTAFASVAKLFFKPVKMIFNKRAAS